jgi:hypothetical protein
MKAQIGEESTVCWPIKWNRKFIQAWSIVNKVDLESFALGIATGVSAGVESLFGFFFFK